MKLTDKQKILIYQECECSRNQIWETATQEIRILEKRIIEIIEIIEKDNEDD